MLSLEKRNSGKMKELISRQLNLENAQIVNDCYSLVNNKCKKQFISLDIIK